MSFLRKATFVATGGASGMVFKANSKKERTAKAMEKQVRLQKQQMRLQRPARTDGMVPAMTWSPSPPPPVSQVAPWSLADELTKLAALREQGILTDEEFDEQKHRLLESQGPPKPELASEAEKRTGGLLAGLQGQAQAGKRTGGFLAGLQAQAGAAAGQAVLQAKQDRKAATEAAKLEETAERGARPSDDG